MLLASLSSADLVIEDISLSGDVDTVSQLPKESGFKEKSEWGTAFLNLAIPGSGHLYLGKKKRAMLYFTIDIALLGGAIFTEATSRNIYDNAAGMASRHSGTSSTRKSDDKYWSIIGNKNFMTSDEYNSALRNNRDFESQYTNIEDKWEWESDEYRDEYSDMRDKAGYYNQAFKLFIGGMILNRAIAFIDGRVSAKKYNRTGVIASSIKVIPQYAFASKTSSFTFLYSF